jgi:GMP synthase-like glutamine amidotransferase
MQLFQHVPFEGPGSIADWVRERGHTLSRTEFFSGATPPATADFDWLVVMGGPMGVSDEDAYPWLAVEKRVIYEAITAGKRVLGICLGAQLIASVLGANVYPGTHKEIGWYPLVVTPQGKDDPLGAALAGEGPVFHWHGDTFDIPEGALHLVASEVCAHQAFRYDTHVVGLQFHLEMNPESLGGMIRHGASELAEGGMFVQTVAELSARPEYLFENRQRLFRLLDTLAEA